MPRNKLQKAEDGLRKLWQNDEHYGIPEDYRTSELTIHRAEAYRALCELVSRSPLSLDKLWTKEPWSLLTAVRDFGNSNFGKAVEQAKQAVLDEWKRINLETYDKEMSRRVRNRKRATSNEIGDSRSMGTGPRVKIQQLSQPGGGRRSCDVSGDGMITSASEGERDRVAHLFHKDRSDTGDIDPNEPKADKVFLWLESPTSSTGAEIVEDIVEIAGSEDVQGHSPEPEDHANTLRQKMNPLPLCQEAMAMSSPRSSEEADKLTQIEQQLEVSRDHYAQLKQKLQDQNNQIDQLDKKRGKIQVKLQDKNNEIGQLDKKRGKIQAKIDQLDKKRRKIQAKLQQNRNLVKTLQQVAELL